MRHWTDIVAGPMTPFDIAREIEHILNGYKNPSELRITIRRRRDGRFQTSIYMLVNEFDNPPNDDPYP